MELGCSTRLDAARLAQRLRRQAGIGALGIGVSREFAADRGGRTPECAGHGPHARTRRGHARDRHALLRLKLLVGRSSLHLCTLPEEGCCTSDLRPPDTIDQSNELIANYLHYEDERAWTAKADYERFDGIMSVP